MVILVALIFCAHKQTSYWRNSEVLWTHTLACTSNNDTAQYNLAEVLLKKGRIGEAITHYKQSLQINPGDKDAQNDLGVALFQSGNVDEAIVHYQQALKINPDFASAHYNLGNALLQNGNVDRAIVHYQQALKINPDYADAHYTLGNALLQNGNVDQAIVHYRQALKINPNFADAQNNLAWELATAAQASLRNGQQAIKLAQQANQVAGGHDPIVLRTLAAAYAETGRFGDAQRSAQKAMDLARATGQTDMMKQIEGEMKCYATGLPFHQENK
jgi:tetratricopeptide (TPR) repeat protein